MTFKLPQPKKAPAETYITDGKMSHLERDTAEELYDRFNSTTSQVILELFGQPQMGKTKTMIYTALNIVEKDPNAFVFMVTSIDRVSQKRNMKAKIDSLYKYIGSDRIYSGVSRYHGEDFESDILKKLNDCPSCNIYVFYDEGHYGIQFEGSFSNTIYDLISHKNCRLLMVGATNTQAQLSQYQMSRVTMKVPESYWGMQQVANKIGTDYFLDRGEVTDLEILEHIQKTYEPGTLDGYCAFWRTSEKNVDSLVDLIGSHSPYDWVIATSPGSKSIDSNLYNEGLNRISPSGFQPKGIAEIVDNVWVHLANQPKFLIVIIVDAFIAGDDFEDNKFRIISWIESNTQLNAHTQSIGRIFCHLNWPLSWWPDPDLKHYETPGLINSNNLMKVGIRNHTLVVAHQHLIEAQVKLNNTLLSDISPELFEEMGILNVGTGLKLSGSSDTKSVQLSNRYTFDSFDKRSIILTLIQDGVSVDDAEEMWLRIQKYLVQGKVGRSSGVTSLIQPKSYQGEYSVKNKINYHGNDMYVFDFNRNNPLITIGGIITDTNLEIYVKNGHTTDLVTNPISVSNSTIFA